MTYWSEFREKFVKNSHDQLEKIQDLGNLLYDKTRAGGIKIAELTKEEFEILKLKHRLHGKHQLLTETFQKIGDLYLDAYQAGQDAGKNPAIQELVHTAENLEVECRSLEADLKNKGSDPELNWENFKEPVTTPY